MKKFIASASLLLSVGFALALANAEDTPSNSSANMSKDTSVTESSTVSDSSGAMKSPDSRDMNKEMRVEKSHHEARTEKGMKSCTDLSGTTFKRGQKGYRECLMSMDKQKSPEQQGGQAGMPYSSSSDRTETTEEKSSSNY